LVAFCKGAGFRERSQWLEMCPSRTRYGNSTVSALPTLQEPAGWTLLGRVQYCSAATLALYTHAVMAGDGSSSTWTASMAVYGAATVAAYSGVDTAMPIDTSAGLDDEADASCTAQCQSTCYTVPSPFPTAAISTTSVDELIVAAFAGWGPNSANNWSVPAMTLRQQIDDTLGRSEALSDLRSSSSGSFSPYSATDPPAPYDVLTFVFALRPRLGGG